VKTRSIGFTHGMGIREMNWKKCNTPELVIAKLRSMVVADSRRFHLGNAKVYRVPGDVAKAMMNKRYLIL
jgi:hypothetical protein